MGSPPRLAIYPGIELRRGQPASRSKDPATATAQGQLREFEAAGARWLHVTDIDAAMGEKNQWSTLTRLLSDTRSRFQYGGGVRHMTQVQQLLDLGVERVVIGTQAVRNPLWLREVVRIFPGRIVLGIDGDGGDVVLDGRREPTSQGAAEVAGVLDDAGLAGIVYSDVAEKPDLGVLRELRASCKNTPLLAMAPQATMADLDALAEIGLDGAVVSISVHDGRLDLEAAVERYPPPPAWPLRVVASLEPEEA
jgi:phosphoribosylformimino-5-aminoimidazole carboxamide ribotide isomerase